MFSDRLCFATHNANKLKEASQAIGPSLKLVSLSELGHWEELPETTPTLEGNSFQKADFVFQHFQIPCFADDTGLEVEALHGAPGVLSARYAGEQKNNQDNIELLLKNLSGISHRKARFRTVITLITGPGKVFVFEGTLHGSIRDFPQGHLGFGYDPIFQPEGYPLTLAEMTLEQKNALSHRGIAIRKLSAFLTGQMA